MGRPGLSLAHLTRADHAPPTIQKSSRAPTPEVQPVPAAAVAAEATPPEPMRPEWEQTVLRWAWILPILWVVCQALAFNGQWRVSLDSAIYRHVACSLAAGEGYVVLGEPQTQIYPGLPLLLAGLERMFGPVVWPAELVMVLFAGATAAFTFLLMRRIVAPWVAVVVTAGVAFNGIFFELSHELLTDVPFLLGVTMALWGWEAITEPGGLRRLRAATVFMLGLGLAASMRPTFWVLAAAWGLVCVGGVIVNLVRTAREGGRGASGPAQAPSRWLLLRSIDASPDTRRSWRFYVACLGVIVVVGALFLIVDPRSASSGVLGGAYEADVIERLRTLGRWLSKWPALTWEILHDHLPRLFFAERMVGLNLITSGALLVGVGIFARRRLLWGLIVLMLLVAVYLASSAPRYYLMVLPILWVGWISVVMRVAERFKTRRGQSIFVGICLGVVLLANFGHVVKTIIEQRRTPFIEHYSRGRYAPLIAAGKVLREHTAPGDVIIGPYARVLSYESDRRVLGAKELLSGAPNSEAARAYALVESPATWMIFPADGYQYKDDSIGRLVENLIIVPDNADGRDTWEIGFFGDYMWYVTRFAIDPYALEGQDASREE